jgi:hypothetical protein
MQGQHSQTAFIRLPASCPGWPAFVQIPLFSPCPCVACVLLRCKLIEVCMWTSVRAAWPPLDSRSVRECSVSVYLSQGACVLNGIAM